MAQATDASGTTAFTRDPDGGILAEKRPSGNTYYYVPDGLGSVVAVTGSTGSVVDTYQYDPYGKIVASTGTLPNAWRYRGGYLDTSTGLYQMGMRYYDPKIGRFTQGDIARDLGSVRGVNPYAYAADDPINLADPSGEQFAAWGATAPNAPYRELEMIKVDFFIFCDGSPCQRISLTGCLDSYRGRQIGYLPDDCESGELKGEGRKKVTAQSHCWTHGKTYRGEATVEFKVAGRKPYTQTKTTGSKRLACPKG